MGAGIFGGTVIAANCERNASAAGLPSSALFDSLTASLQPASFSADRSRDRAHVNLLEQQVVGAHQFFIDGAAQFHEALVQRGFQICQITFSHRLNEGGRTVL